MTVTDTEPTDGTKARGPRHVRRPTTRWWAHRWSIAIWVLLPYQVLSLIVLWPLVARGITTHLPFGTDAVLDSWGYSWLPHAVTHWMNPFVTDYVNFPGQVNLLANTTQLALALVEWPLTALAGPTASFNVACLAAPTLSAAAMYLLARTVTERRLIAWAGGLLYGFSGYMLTALGSFHFQLFFVPIPPLLFLALHHLVAVRRQRPWMLGLGIAGLVVIQFFISTEVLMMTAVMVAGAGLCALALCWHQIITSWRYILSALGTAAGATISLLAWPAWIAIAGPGHISGLVILTPQAYRADLLGPIFPTIAQAIAPARPAAIASHFATASSENYSYLGIPLLLVTVLGMIVLWRNRTVVVAGIVAVAAFILSLGGALVIAGTPTQGSVGNIATGTWMPGRLLEQLPLFENIIPSRWALFTSIGVALIAVALLDRMVTSLPLPGAARVTAAVALVVMVVVPLLPRLPLGEASLSIEYKLPKHMQQLVANTIPHGAAVISYPYPTGGNFMRPVTWQAAMDFPFKMPAGYFRVPQGSSQTVGFDPVYGYGFSSYPAQVLVQLEAGTPPSPSANLREAFLAPLHTWGVRWLLAGIGPGQHRRTTNRYLEHLLGQPVAHNGGVWIYRVPQLHR